jgi:hypothetical protein
MLAALINRCTGEVVIVKKLPCVWSERERATFDVVEFEDVILESSMVGSVKALPYAVFQKPAPDPTGNIGRPYLVSRSGWRVRNKEVLDVCRDR